MSTSSSRSAPWTNCYDPFVALSYIAANTSRIRLGVSVLIVPYRNPIATAKALATIDRMSGGRLICGVGVGWNEAEFAALGVKFDERGPRTNEYLRVWQACWGPDKISFAGKFVAFDEMYVSPKPLQQPHPPFWCGGASDAALRRAARTRRDMAADAAAAGRPGRTQGRLAPASAAIGRQAPPDTRMSFRVDFSRATPAQVVSELSRYREAAGLDAFQINFHGNRDLGQLLDAMELFTSEVKPQLA